MNLILLFDGDFLSPDRVRLTGRRLAHIATVHRAEPGRALRVGRVDDRLGSGVVRRIDADSVELEVSFDSVPPAPLPVRLVLALPRPKSLRRLLQAVAAMGVKDLTLLNTWRVDKSYWGSPLLTPQGMREQLLLGLEQGRDTVVPQVRLRRLFKPFVEDELPTLTADTVRLVAHPGAEASCPPAATDPTTLVIGPEGGLIPYELDALVAAGFTPIGLGPRILRVEQAVPALLARLFL
jgi:RsmE family RNA methyltransferase